MLALFGVLIIIASIVLGLIVLIQNPKGGGLSGSLSGFGNQLMGVKQTTDVLEKGTWIFAGVIGVLCLLSTVFISGNSSNVPNTSSKLGNSSTINNNNNPLTPSTTTTVPASPTSTPPSTN